MPSWNEAYIKTITKEQFIADHKHLATDKELAMVYDKIVPPKKEAPKEPETEGQ